MAKAKYIPAERFKTCNSCGCDCIPAIIWQNAPLCDECAEKWNLKKVKSKKVPNESTMVQSILNSAGSQENQSSDQH
jgi:hypothetical protein